MSIINLDWSLIDKKSLTHDLVKVFIFNLCAHIMSVLYFKEDYLNQKFLLILFAIELGFTLFYIFFEPVIFHTMSNRAARRAARAASESSKRS